MVVGWPREGCEVCIKKCVLGGSFLVVCGLVVWKYHVWCGGSLGEVIVCWADECVLRLCVWSVN